MRYDYVYDMRASNAVQKDKTAEWTMTYGKLYDPSPYITAEQWQQSMREI